MTSNGDYDLTYEVSGANLPNNPKLTIAVYWAVGLGNVATIIPGTAPIAVSQLAQSIGTHTVPVQIVQLINPPANATTLVAVLDNSHVLSPTDETNSVITLSESNALVGYTLLTAPLSFELQTVVPAPSGPYDTVREARVFSWLRKYSLNINAAGKTYNYNIDPVAIAGAIAWEALQNVDTAGILSVGPGKVHVIRTSLSTPLDVDYIQGKHRYSPITPDVSPAALVSSLKTAGGSIQYIAAILNAYATEAQLAGGPNFRNGFYHERAHPSVLAKDGNGNSYTNASILDSYYVGEGNIVPGQKGAITLSAAPAGFKTRLSYPDEFVPGSTMGQWVAHNDDFLRLALGLPTRSPS